MFLLLWIMSGNGKSVFQIKKSGKVFEMPLSDRQMSLIEQETGIDLFVPIENAVLVNGIPRC